MTSQVQLNLDVLPTAQRLLWDKMGGLREDFVLYGGTALALHLGHRQSVDFDFFSRKSFRPQELYATLHFLDGGNITQTEPNTLSVLASVGGESVALSFFGGLNLQCVEAHVWVPPGLRIAGVKDLFGCKCATVQQRDQVKDYVDICAVLKQTGFSLADGLSFAQAVYGDQFNPLITLRALSQQTALDRLSAEDSRILNEAVQSVELDGIRVVTVAGALGAASRSSLEDPPA